MVRNETKNSEYGPKIRFSPWLLEFDDKIKRSTNSSSTNNFVSRSVIKAGTLGIYRVVRDEWCFYRRGMDYFLHTPKI